MSIQEQIASFTKAERDFYQECADIAGETLEQWVAHMDEV